MKCVICNKTEKEFLKIQSAHFSQIKGILETINANITNLQKIYDDKNDYDPIQPLHYGDGCKIFNSENCGTCLRRESIDDEGNYWCPRHKKSFKRDVEGTKIFNLHKEKKILEKRIEIIGKAKFDIFEISYEDVFYGNDEDFKKTISKYHCQNRQEEKIHFAMCPYCKIFINKITENKKNEQFGGILGIFEAIFNEEFNLNSFLL